MTAKNRFDAAFEGRPGYPVALCYEGLVIRDHIDTVSDKPWEYCIDADIQKRYQWHVGVKNRLSHDWVVYPFPYCYNEPPVNVTKPVSGGSFHWPQNKPKIDSKEQIDACIPLTQLEPLPPAGELDTMLQQLYADRPKLSHVSAPFWQCSGRWDFNELMMLTINNPQLLEYACERITKNTLIQIQRAQLQGCAMIWIEDCYSDMLSPALFQRFNIAYIKEITAAVQKAGMRCVHYYCGSLHNKLDLLLSTNSDAYAFEESKKGFDIDIVEIAKYVNGRHCLFGNIDAVGVLQDGSPDDIRREISRQAEAGRLNGDRFVFGLGSPVTPLTPMERVMDFIGMVRDLV